MPRLDAAALRAVLEQHFLAAGADPDAARHVVASTVETSLRGVDSHGIHLVPHYSRAVRGGRVNPRPRMRRERERPAAVLLDADHAFGHHAGSVAVEIAEELAAAAGVGAVAVAHSTHLGAAAYFGLQAARRGHIALAFTNADALVAPYRARAPFFGTNPICFCAPMEREEPFCLDMATSRVSWNKVLNRRGEQVALEPGWALDEHGDPTTDPQAARMLVPIGDYKGYGLGMMIEILCGLLASGPAAREILPMYTTPIAERRHISHFFMVLRIDSFTDPGAFRARLQRMADELRALPGGVLVAGDPEKREHAERSARGIPIGDERLAQLLETEPRVATAICSS